MTILSAYKMYNQFQNLTILNTRISVNMYIKICVILWITHTIALQSACNSVGAHRIIMAGMAVFS